jgi:regulator of cell morphogenesis and NO signaling
MQITPDMTVAAIATAAPATIRVFQQHQIDFCCGGKVALQQACAAKGLSAESLLGELRAALTPQATEIDWSQASLTSLVRHIQGRYHAHLRAQIPYLDALLAKVIRRHGEHLPAVLTPLQATFAALRDELLAHMDKEDGVLFPFIEALEAGGSLPAPEAEAWLATPVAVMEAEHAHAGAALASMRAVTGGYAPPEWACPTFRGLYYGLAQLETDMHVHVHLENNILFPRAVRLASARKSCSSGARQPVDGRVN